MHAKPLMRIYYRHNNTKESTAILPTSCFAYEANVPLAARMYRIHHAGWKSRLPPFWRIVEVFNVKLNVPKTAQTSSILGEAGYSVKDDRQNSRLDFPLVQQQPQQGEEVCC
jgi:hypothetical protein